MTKAFVTSIGEKTTEICCDQLKRFGFNVILLDDKESWLNKYKRFIRMADEDCLRVDADIIVNENIKKVGKENVNAPMTQYSVYDLYQNNIKAVAPMFYRKEAIEIIRENLDKLHLNRPETSAWRLEDMPDNLTSDLVVGMHGFFQDIKTIERAKENKINRKQLGYYDFDLIFKLIKL